MPYPTSVETATEATGWYPTQSPPVPAGSPWSHYLDSPLRRIRGMHALWIEALDTMDVDQVNHVEDGVLRMGEDPDRVLAFIDAQGDVGNQFFQAMLFSKIVPNCKKLGLLDAGDGWLRQRFTDLQIIQFEDWADTSDEYETFDLAAGG